MTISKTVFTALANNSDWTMDCIDGVEAVMKSEGDVETIWIISQDKISYPDIQVEKFVLSNKSDVYIPEHNYGGIILYSHKGKTDWRLNGIHCKTGYIVILDTDSERVKSMIATSPGIVHGAVYKCIFGEDPAPDTIGEGFAFLNGEYRWNSWSFNGKPSAYHDGQKRISKLTESFVGKVLNIWKQEGVTSKSLPTCQNYSVASLKES